MKNEKKSKYVFLWSDYQPDYTIETNLESIARYPKIDWNNIKNIIEVSRGNKISAYHSREDLENDAERGKKILDEKYFKNLIDNSEKVYTDYQKMFKDLKNVDYSKLSDKRLFDYFLRMTDMWSLVISYFRFSQAEGTRYLVEKIKSHVSEEEASLLMLSPQLDIINLEQIDWERLLKNPFSEKAIIKHIYKYPWVVAVHFTHEDAIETLKQRYDYDKKHPQNKDIKKEKKKLRKKQVKIINNNQELKRLTEISQRIALSRAELKSCWAGTDWYMIPFFKELSKRTKEDVFNLQKYYLIGEMEDLLFNEIKLSQEEFKRRDKCFVGLWKNNKISYYSGNEAEEIAEEELGILYKISTKKEFKGTSANLGNVSGIVHILHAGNVENVRKVRKSFKKGEILVTEMTQPNVMDIASKAAAIITDEGGMLSHAAIISRELKIPCVVGTHSATTLLKDGDKVEVNGNKGVIKIIEKK